MNVEAFRDFCLSLSQVQENSPWTNPLYRNLITFTIGGKWFCLFDPDKKFIDIKSTPEKIQELLSTYKGAFPAWHMNKQHWIGVNLESDLPDTLIKDLLTESYNLVLSSISGFKTF